jgi:sulfhydrogenase subunit beta (sulfur reductase)
MVMDDKKFLSRESIMPFLKRLSKDRTVIVPVREESSVTFRPFSDQYPCMDEMPTMSAKEAVFPKCETLMIFRLAKDKQDTTKNRFILKETLPEQRLVVFGDRPCGARGREVFDRVYDNGKVKDPYYVRRREGTVFINLACSEPENTCFCQSMGGGPGNPEGSDILLTPVTGGFLAEAFTEKGKGLFFQDLFEEPGDRIDEAAAVKEQALMQMGPPEDFLPARQKLLELFDNKDYWARTSGKCIACGVCTYLCPTCYCFNITDETSGDAGKRIRTWDTCMQAQFTLEASGHNPRTMKPDRLKNRIGHKFSYYPSIHGIISCCGCGRCIKNCPVSLDIREVVRSAIGA